MDKRRKSTGELVGGSLGEKPMMPSNTPGGENLLASIGGDGLGVRLGDGKIAPGMHDGELNLKPDGKVRTQEWTDTLMRYRAGKQALESRVIEAEDYWKLRHWRAIRPSNPGEPEPASAWLVNTILSKHSDAVDAYPEPVCLAREEGDKAEAESLSSIMPVVLEQNDFAQVWSDVWWYKLKSGTGVYGVFWDPNKLNGLGDISVQKVDILNLFWEPGVTDIQNSRYVFHVTLVDNDILEEQHPELSGKLKGGTQTPVTSKFHYDESIRTDDKSAVVDVYYKRKGILHFAKYVGDTILFCTEDDPEYAERGLYDHGQYPFIFDPLFPEEGYPSCGYGYVDLCRDPQLTVDIMNNAMLQSSVAAATPRWFIRKDGNVNEEEYADLTKKFVHVQGSIGEESVRQIQTAPMPAMAMEYLQLKVNEIKEISGNRDVNNGSSAHITAAAAIAALQEAGNGLSRDMISSGYRAFRKVVNLCLELIRQFYDLPRKFRIMGSSGMERYIAYSNANIQTQMVPTANPAEQQFRTPIFDIQVQVQSEASYTKQAYNDLAIQLYQLGIFDPQNAVRASMMLEMMDFKGKDALLAKVQMNGMMQQQLQMWQQMAISAAGASDPEMARGLAQAAGMQVPQQASLGGATSASGKRDRNGDGKTENTYVEKARANAEGGAIPR